MGCFAFAIGAGRHEDWTTGKTLFVGAAIAFFMIIVYGVIMTPKVAKANRTDTKLTSGEVYYFYEDHIGRPVTMSCYNLHSNSYFMPNMDYPYFIALYKPFGQMDDAWVLSMGITMGDPNTTGIVWQVPFRFPGQYQDDVAGLRNQLYYNWNRWYMPGMGRYTQADPIRIIKNNLFAYAKNNPFKYIDFTGLLINCTCGSYSGDVTIGLQYVYCKCNSECINNKMNKGTYSGLMLIGSVGIPISLASFSFSCPGNDLKIMNGKLEYFTMVIQYNEHEMEGGELIWKFGGCLAKGGGITGKAIDAGVTGGIGYGSFDTEYETCCGNR